MSAVDTASPWLPSLDGMEGRLRNTDPFGSPGQHIAQPGHLCLARFPRMLQVEEQGV